MILNPSFELVSESGRPKSWRSFAWSNDPSFTTFNLDKSVARSGSNSICITNNKQNHSYYVQAASVKENKHYKITGWVKTENVGKVEGGDGGAGISLIGYFELGGNLQGTQSEWKQVELYATIQKGVNYIEIQLGIGNYGAVNTGKAWFDDISMEEVSSIPSGAKVSVVIPATKQRENASLDSESKGKKSLDEAGQSAMMFIIIIIIVVIIGGTVLYVVLTIYKKKKPEDRAESEVVEGEDSDEIGELEEIGDESAESDKSTKRPIEESGDEKV